MSDKEQTEAFAGDIWNVIDRYRKEFDLTTAAAVGVLQLIAWEIIKEADDRETGV